MTEIPTQDLLILCQGYNDIYNHIIRYMPTRIYELFNLFYEKSDIICDQYFEKTDHLRKSYGI